MNVDELRGYARGLREGKCTPTQRCKLLEDAIENGLVSAEWHPRIQQPQETITTPWIYHDTSTTGDDPGQFTTT